MSETNDSGSWQSCLFGGWPAVATPECTYIGGDGIGGTEEYIGSYATKELCAQAVSTQKPTANGATYSTGGGTSCYAEDGMSETNDSGSWQSCLFGGWPAVATPECTYIGGDGIGGTEEYLGSYASKELCAQAVHKNKPTANGATYSTSGTSCYAEYSMSDVNGSGSWQSCLFGGWGVNCNYSAGDGVGGTEEYIGSYATKELCAKAVRSQKPSANGATYSTGSGTSCYAEYGM